MQKHVGSVMCCLPTTYPCGSVPTTSVALSNGRTKLVKHSRAALGFVLLTLYAVKSMWVKRELRYALIEKRFEDRIIPLVFKKCEFRVLSWTLPQFQLIDFTKDYCYFVSPAPR